MQNALLLAMALLPGACQPAPSKPPPDSGDSAPVVDTADSGGCVVVAVDDLGREYCSMQDAIDAVGLPGTLYLTGEPIRETVRVWGTLPLLPAAELPVLHIDGGAGTLWEAPPEDAADPRAILHIAYAGLTLTDVTLTSGTGQGDDCIEGDCRFRAGGALYAQDSLVRLERVILEHNAADGGGGVFLFTLEPGGSGADYSLSLVNSVVRENEASAATSWGGGGVLSWGADVVSEDTDWGAEDRDNWPTDVRVWAADSKQYDYSGYGAHSTFTCSGETGLCDPPP